MRWFWIIFIAVIAVLVVAILRPPKQSSQIDPIAPSASPQAQPIAIDHRSSTSFPGTGSTTDPYRLTWPILMSAQAGEGPDGTLVVPNDIARFDGTSIEISGYLAPPVACEETSELLVMQKRWDGCCIGTPPTPFDCVEVRLEQPVAVRGKHLIQYGTVRGILRIEPFYVGTFMLGLYRIEHGQVDGFGG